MKVSFHLGCSSDAGAALIQSLEFSGKIDASEILPLLGAQSLAVWDGGCRVSEMFKKGALTDGKTYHVYARNEERTRIRLKTLAKINK